MERTNHPTFDRWEHATLVAFAHDAYKKLQEQDDTIQQLQRDLKDAYKKLQEQDDTIQQLQRDLKDAIAAYRQLMMLHEDDGR